ncbi:phytoene desaturase, partial [Haematococcus lacustris]
VLEAPWRLPTANLRDYFNYDLDERKWREYCRKVEQYRAEFTLRNQIRTVGAAEQPAAGPGTGGSEGGQRGGPGGGPGGPPPGTRFVGHDPSLPPEVNAMLMKVSLCSTWQCGAPGSGLAHPRGG